MPAVSGPERVPHAHHVPFTRGVAPRQPIVLWHDRQLVGGPLSQAEGGGIGERPARAVGGRRRGPLETPWFHPRPHREPVGSPFEAELGRSLGARPDPLHQPTDDEQDGDEDSQGDATRLQGVHDGRLRTRPDGSPPHERRQRARDDRRSEGEHVPAALREALAAGVSDDGLREPPPPLAGETQPGDLDAGPGDAGQQAGSLPMDVVEDLLLVRREHVAGTAAPVGEQHYLLVGLLDAQPAACDEVEQGRIGCRRGHDETVREQAGNGWGLVPQLVGRGRCRQPGRSSGDARTQQQQAGQDEQDDRPPQRRAVGCGEERRHCSPRPPDTRSIMASRGAADVSTAVAAAGAGSLPRRRPA